MRVKGSVVRVGSIKPKLTAIVFFCQKCGGSHAARMTDGVYRVPPKCPVGGCGAPGGKFLVPDRAAAETRCVSWQSLRLQEIFEDAEGDGGDGGRVPRHIEVEVDGTLVDAAAPGDIVDVGAIVKAADLAEGTPP